MVVGKMGQTFQLASLTNGTVGASLSNWEGAQ